MRNGPRVISLFGRKKYNDIYQDISVLREKNFFLKCNCHEAIIPVYNKNEHQLNIFEETILKLLNFKDFTITELQEKTCLEKDLIEYILNALVAKGYLNENICDLTDEGKQLLDSYAEQKNIVSGQKACFFSLFDTGELLPLLLIGDVTYMDATYSNGGISMYCGDTKGKITKLGAISITSNHRVDKKPTQNALRKVIRKYNRLNIKKVKVAENYHIDISEGYEVFLHLKIVLQDGYVNQIIVSDGQQPNRGTLVQYMNTNHGSFVANFKQDATSYSSNDTGVKKTGIGEKYRHIKDLMTFKDAEGANKDQNEVLNDVYKNEIQNVFAAIEWALHYHLKYEPIQEQILSAYEAQSFDENKQLTMGLAKKIGLQDIDKNKNLFNCIDKRKIILYQETQIPTLYTLLPLTIAMAARDSDNRFNNLIQEMPDILNYLNKLNSMSKNLRHTGKTQGNNINVKEIIEKAKKIIKILLPDYDLKTEIQKVNINTASINKLNAEVSVSKVLGWDLFSSLDFDLQRELLQTSPDKTKDKMLSAYEFIKSLSRCLEKLFRIKISEIPGKENIKKSDVIKIVTDVSNTELPKSLQYVNDYYFKEALGERPATLGAYTLVILGVSDEDDRKKLLDSGIVDLVDKIVNYRGHGNSVGLSLRENQLADLRTKVYKIIQIMEAL